MSLRGVVVRAGFAPLTPFGKVNLIE